MENMAILNSYVKLPEGMFFVLILKLFVAEATAKVHPADTL